MFYNLYNLSKVPVLKPVMFQSVICMIAQCFDLFTALQLLEEMLSWDADNRVTAENALKHPYLADHADPENEPESEPYDELYEDMEFDVETWKG